MLEDRIVPERLAHAIVVETVNCRRCGYDVRGQRVDGRCPECGEPVYPSVVGTLDPDASRLPTLRDPRRVGDGLLWIVLSMLASIIFSRMHPVAVWMDSLDSTGTDRFSALVPVWVFVTAPLVLGGALWGVHLLMPRHTTPVDDTIIRDLRILRTGIIAVGIGVTIVNWPGLRPGSIGIERVLLIIAQFGLGSACVLTLTGLHHILRAVGQRSRVYRKARGGKQGINALIAAVLCVLLGRMLEFVTPDIPLIGRAWTEWRSIGAGIVTIGYLMLVIGLMYLSVNMLWIRRALRQVPPTLDEILVPPLPADTTIISPDDEPDEPFTVRIKGE